MSKRQRSWSLSPVPGKHKDGPLPGVGPFAFPRGGIDGWLLETENLATNNAALSSSRHVTRRRNCVISKQQSDGLSFGV